MLNFTMISGLIARTSPRATNSRRKVRTSLVLESLEGRDLMSVSGITGPPVPVPTPGPGWITTSPPDPAPHPHNTLPPSLA